MDEIDRRTAFTTAAAAALGLVAFNTDGLAQPAGGTPSTQAITPPASPPPPQLTSFSEAVVRSTFEASLQHDKTPVIAQTPLTDSDFTLPFDRGPLAQAFNDVVARLRAGVELPDLSRPQPSLSLATLGTAFTFTAENGECDFLPQHTEGLLNQAADLLDRCLALSKDWNELAARSFEVRLAIEEYQLISAIHQDEAAAGFYSVQARESAAEALAELFTHTSSSNAEALIQWLRQTFLSSSEIGRQSGFAQLAAWVTQYATYQADHKDPLLTETFDGITKTKPLHLKDAASGQAFHTLGLQEATVHAELEVRSGLTQASAQRQTGRSVRAAWEAKDQQFRRRRTDVAQKMADYRAHAFASPGGTLNFPEQMAATKARFDRDFRDALARALRAADGLRDIYGYPTPLPQSVLHVTSGHPATPATFEDLFLWVRDAIAWLIRFTMRDQFGTTLVSMRDVLGDEGLERALSHGSWQFTLKDELFDGYTSVRLRGLSAVVDVGGFLHDHYQRWAMRLTPPTNARVHLREQGTKPICQAAPPFITLGRVESRNSERAPNLYGEQPLHNLSPLGTWSVSAKPLGENKKKRQVDDVWFEFHHVSQ